MVRRGLLTQRAQRYSAQRTVIVVGVRRPRPRPVAHIAVEAAFAEAQRRPAPRGMSVAEFGIPAAVVAVLAQRGIHEPTDIQARTMPDALAGRDVLGPVQTGSGKTLAFGLPRLARLHAVAQPRMPRAPRPRARADQGTGTLPRLIAHRRPGSEPRPLTSTGAGIAHQSGHAVVPGVETVDLVGVRVQPRCRYTSAGGRRWWCRRVRLSICAEAWDRMYGASPPRVVDAIGEHAGRPVGAAGLMS